MHEEESFEFIKACTMNGAYLELADSKRGNKQAGKIYDLFVFFRENNMLNELLKFLKHFNPHVRYFTARWLLQSFPQESEKVLEELSQHENTIVSFNARICLHEWKKGNLPFKSFPD